MYIGGLSHGGLCLPCCGVLCSRVGGLPCPSQCKTRVTYDKLVFLCNCGNRLYLYENMLHAVCMQHACSIHIALRTIEYIQRAVSEPWNIQHAVVYTLRAMICSIHIAFRTIACSLRAVFILKKFIHSKP